MIKFKKYGEPGTRIPAWYGVAWFEIEYGTTVYYPYPLNIIFGLVRKTYHRIRYYRVRELFYHNTIYIVDKYHKLKEENRELKRLKEKYEEG